MTTLEIFATRTSPIFFPFFSFLENGHMGNKIALKMCSSRFILYFDIFHLSKSLSYKVKICTVSLDISYKVNLNFFSNHAKFKVV